MSDRFDPRKEKPQDFPRRDDLENDLDRDERLDRDADERMMTDYDREDAEVTYDTGQEDERQLPHLVSLTDNPVTLEDTTADVRGFEVLDREGETIGKVDDLLVDEDERRVRFLNVKSGGFLGFGAETHLIPIDAIKRIEEDEVHIDQTREHVGGAPAYDPDVTLDARETYEGIYRHYGYTPFWRPGYAYPTQPFLYRRR